MKLLILAEKSSAYQKFAQVLGGISGNIGTDTYELVHSHGHLLKLKDPQDQVSADKIARYSEWNSYDVFPWNLNDFAWKKTYLDTDAKKNVQQIKQAAQDKDAIVIATDCDPSGEGDLLAWEIIEAIGWRSTVYRAYFSTESKIKEAIINRKDVSDKFHSGEYLEATSRQRFDYGSMQLSRIATLAAKQAGYNPKVLRLGRFKSALANIVYQQWQKIKNYVKKPYFEVRYKDANGNVFKRNFQDDDTFRFEHKSDANNDLLNYKPDNVVIDSNVTKTTEPPSLINLMGLADLLSKKGFTTSQVKDTYQKMYEAEYVSYPRTEDTKVDQKDFDELLPLVDSIANVVGVDHSLLTHRTARKKYITAKADHGANRPGINVPTSLDELEKKFGKCGKEIYITLAKAYLAILCEDYVYEQQKAHLANNPDFKSVSNLPKKLNYKLVFNEQDLDSDSNKSNHQGFLSTVTPYIYEGSNPAPAKPTLSFLRKFLKKNNIGTGATQLTTITDISNPKDPTALLKVKNNVYELTFNGLASDLLTQGCQISSPHVTKQLLEYMKEVKLFKIEFEKIPTLMTTIVKHDMPIIRQNINVIKNNSTLQKLALDLPKPAERVNGIYSPTGEEINFSRIFSGHRFTDEEIQQLLAGQTIKVNCKSKKGTAIIVPGKLSEKTYQNKKFWGFSFDVNKIEFPDDGTRTTGIFKPTGQKVTFKNSWSSHKFTDSELQTLLNGETITIECTSKKGTPLSVEGKLSQQKYKDKTFWGFAYDKNTIKFIDNNHFTGIYTPNGKEIRFKNSWSTHKFTESEKDKLLAGQKIRIKLKAKKGSWYATGGLKEQEYKGKTFWGFYVEKKEWA
ncbi:DNA topoisomerase [Lactobacillus paragasseri]|uniref:DNA topoisomerase n=1 Tax=Lactobacillus paragasseri TaxID=2107999 RepID=UPI00189B522F|nr:DNA topoisomerase [Lactobacillus paragasseri]